MRAPRDTGSITGIHQDLAMLNVRLGFLRALKDLQHKRGGGFNGLGLLMAAPGVGVHRSARQPSGKEPLVAAWGTSVVRSSVFISLKVPQEGTRG